MTMQTSPPSLPENSPFTGEQRMWLNGYMAGLFGSGGEAVRDPAGRPGQMPGIAGAEDVAPRTLPIFYGSQSGNAEALAFELEDRLKGLGREKDLAVGPRVLSLEDYAEVDWGGLRDCLFICSTWGDGEYPDNAKAFGEWLHSEAAPRLKDLRFAVLALGDSSYTRFCGAGESLARRLRELGAVPIVDLTKCDTDYEVNFESWCGRLSAFASENWGRSADAPARVEARGEPEPGAAGTREERPGKTGAGAPVYGKKHPFPAVLLENRRLNSGESRKDTRHFTFSLAGSGLNYRPGDAVGVWPKNDPALVRTLCEFLGYRGRELVVFGTEERLPILGFLLERADLHKVPLRLLRHFGEKGVLPRALQDVAADESRAADYLRGRDLLDVVMECPGGRLSPEELARLLNPLSPRLYSIASSSAENADEVQLTVGVVRTRVRDRLRNGVCSTYLAERVPVGERVRLYLQPNQAFRLPDDPDAALILVGPGTGIAPFRGYLRERRVLGHRGPNWLFFGDRHRDRDFLYREELEAMLKEGLLTRLDLAFSRDQAEKVYVQHLMLSHGAELFRRLQEGAHFRVCGDAKRMAPDVEGALLKVLEKEGGLKPEGAAAYLEKMRKEGRYVRDVY